MIELPENPYRDSIEAFDEEFRLHNGYALSQLDMLRWFVKWLKREYQHRTMSSETYKLYREILQELQNKLAELEGKK